MYVYSTASLHRHPAGSAKAEGNITRGYEISLADIIGDIQYQWGNSLSLSHSPSLSGDPALAVLGKRETGTNELPKRQEQPTLCLV